MATKKKPAEAIKRISVTIRTTTTERRALSTTCSNVGRMGRRPNPEDPLLDALRELGRQAAHFGFATEARKALGEGLNLGAAARAEPLTSAQLAYYHDADGDLEGYDGA